MSTLDSPSLPVKRRRCLLNSAQRAADELRVELVDIARAFGVTVHFEHWFGDPAYELIRTAQEYGADLIGVGASVHALPARVKIFEAGWSGILSSRGCRGRGGHRRRVA